MKTILLIRHSEPIRDRIVPTAMPPLSERGYEKARELFRRDIFRTVDAFCTSPYRRAWDTARELLREGAMTDDRLREWELGDLQTLDAAFWGRQYADHTYRNKNGESLNDAGKRMTAALREIMAATPEGGTAAVVSHAAAICAFLLNWCSIEVVDEQKKVRKIQHSETVVLDGKIAAPSVFVLRFAGGQLREIRHMDAE